MSNWNMKEGSVWQQDDGSGDISPENLPDYCEWLENRVAYLEAMVERLIEAGDDLAGFTMSATGDNGHSITLRKWHALVDRIQKEREE